MTQPFNFVPKFIKATAVTELHPRAYEWAAIFLLASALNSNRLKIENGAISYFLDLWVLLTSGSGTGRSTSLKPLRYVLGKAGLAELVLPNSGSGNAYYQSLAQITSARGTAVGLYSEMSQFLSAIDNYGFEVKSNLTDYFDCPFAPAPITFRETGREGKDTPAIRFDSAPRLGMFATSSEAWLVPLLSNNDALGGFIARWNTVKLPTLDTLVPFPKPYDTAELDRLAAYLTRLSAVRQRDITIHLQEKPDVCTAYETWYRREHEWASTHPNKAAAMAFFNRMRGLILKLAVVLHVSDFPEPDITLNSFIRAEKMMAELRSDTSAFILHTLSAEAADAHSIELAIRNAASKGCPLSALASVISTRQRRVLAVNNLLESQGRVLQFKVKPSKDGKDVGTGGRPANVFVHPDFVERFLGDRAAEGAEVTRTYELLR